MKILLSLTALSLVATSGFAQKPSPPMSTSITAEGKTVSIKYSAPSMRGRKIFGGLVPHGQVWRAGANEATALHTDADLTIGTLNVPKGDYTLYVLPEEKSWTLVVNKQTGQWGTVYNQANDLGRVKMAVTTAASPVEQYKMTLAGGKLTLEWESTAATVPVTVK